MAEALDRPEKAQFHLVTFTFGAPEQTKRFTNWDSDIDPQGLNFISLPQMQFDLAANIGTLSDTSTKIKMQIETLTSTFLDPLTRGTPFAPVHVSIQEVVNPTAIGDSGIQQFVAAGVIYRTRRNADGKTGLVVIEVRSRKTLLNNSLGFQVNAHCVWRLNGVGCTESTHSPSGYATKAASVAIDGKTVTISDPGLLFDLAGTRSWTRGFLDRDNVKIGIFNYDKTQDGSTTKVFQLVRQPPEEWEGLTVTFFPGCSKQATGDSSCDPTAWDNLEAFAGSGIAIPAHNPISENPSGNEV